MIFRIFKKKELKSLFEILAAHNRIVGPVETGRDKDDNPIYAFAEVSDFHSIKLNFSTLPQKISQEDLALSL